MIPLPEEVLSDDEILKVNNGSLEILESTGICIQQDEILKRLEAEGATLDWTGKTAKLPANMVEKFIKKAPAKILLYPRDTLNPIKIGEGITHAVNGFDATFNFDYKTGERKPITKEEVGTFAWIADQLQNIDIVGVQGLPQDVRQEKAEAHAVAALLQNTKKHIIIAPDTGNVAKTVYAMIRLATGQVDIGSKPTVSCHISPSAPLRWTPEACEIILSTVAQGVPFYILPAPMAGATSPVTLAGYIVQHNTQILSGIVITQVLREGSPVVYCNAPTLFNMREGNPIIATPETMLCRIAGSQMARFYHIPSHSIGFDTDAHIVDQQCVWEKALTAMACISAGIDVMVNLGMFSTGLTVSYESLVIDHEIFSLLRRFQKGIEVTKNSLAIDVIKKIGTWGSFLEEEHTLKHFKTENWYPEISCRKLFEPWTAEGGKDAHMVAHEKVLELLGTERKRYIAPTIMEQMDKIIGET
jgi:trimethylamine--corrinoid protein Co-methyltransferase